MPAPIEVTRLLQSIEAFRARAPRDLPEGVLEGLDGVERSLAKIDPPRDSPGARESRLVAAGGTDGTGEHFSKAARGTDQPSPGQRAAAALSADVKKAAQEIAERHRGDSGGA